jgi:drug/metabolite transporter (DMT)-like permease
LLLTPASATGHLGTFVVVIVVGFLVGGVGHATQNRALIITGIIIIAAVSIYFAASGEVQSFH